jgi:hypothetical protein
MVFPQLMRAVTDPGVAAGQRNIPLVNISLARGKEKIIARPRWVCSAPSGAGLEPFAGAEKRFADLRDDRRPRFV